MLFFCKDNCPSVESMSFDTMVSTSVQSWSGHNIDFRDELRGKEHYNNNVTTSTFSLVLYNLCDNPFVTVLFPTYKNGINQQLDSE